MLRARSIAEEHLYMRLHPCRCGHRVDVASLGHATAVADATHVSSAFSGKCSACGNELRFDFLIADAAPKGRATFGGPAASTIIDPGEFYIVSDEFAAAGDLERAIACLEEVLKFIPPGEESVPSACFRAAAGAKLKLASPSRFAHYRIEARIAAYREAATKSSNDRPFKRTTADGGHQLCPNCKGRAWCKWCAGTGKPLGPGARTCDGCAGQRVCPLCEGEGQLVAGHAAFTFWDKPMSHPPRTVEDQAVTEKMRATKAKHMQHRAVMGPPPPTKVPSDSPMFKRWASEELPFGLGSEPAMMPPTAPRAPESRSVPQPAESTVIAIDAHAAAAHGLPAISLRLDSAGTAMHVAAFPDSETYVRASGPPGGPLGFSIQFTAESGSDAAAVERAMRRALSRSSDFEVVDRSPIRLAGAMRDAVVAVTKDWQEPNWLGAIVPTKTGSLLVMADSAFGLGRRVDAATFAAHRSLGPLLRSLVVEGAEPHAAAPSALATRMAFEAGGGGAVATDRTGGPTSVNVEGWERALLERASLHRALGSLLGLAVGDALGTTNEFRTLTAPPFPELATGPLDDIIGEGPFKLTPGEVTDDTQMAAALAELFWKSNRISSALLAVRYFDWRRAAFDVGVQIGQALDIAARGATPELAGREVWESRDRFPAGNGSLMRTAVIGVLLAGVSPEQRRTAAFMDSAITHFDPKCQLACAAFNGAIAHALTGKPSPASMLRAAFDELRAAAAAMREHNSDLVREIDEAEAVLATDLAAARDDDPQLYGEELNLHKGAGFVRVAFRLAFWELMHAPDFRAAVIDAANRGGDADTNAAIVGALLGAFHGVDGIPAAWIDKVLTAPALVAAERELHPKTFLGALARGFGAGFSQLFDHRSVAQLAPYVARAFPALVAEAAPMPVAPAEIGGMRVQAWLRGSNDFGQARVVDGSGRAYVATILGAKSPILEPEPDGVPLSTAMFGPRGPQAARLLAQLLELVQAASLVGNPIAYLSPELVYVVGADGQLRVTGLLRQGDTAAIFTDRIRRFAWIPTEMRCAAPEVLAGTMSGNELTAAGLYSACAVTLFACNRNGSLSLTPIRDKAVAELVEAALQADPKLRPPIRAIVEATREAPAG